MTSPLINAILRVRLRQSILRPAAPSAQLADPHPVNPLGDDDLAMLAVADIAAENSRAAFQRIASPARQVGLIVVGRDPARSLLRWLAFRGSPPGNRCLPDKVVSLI